MEFENFIIAFATFTTFAATAGWCTFAVRREPARAEVIELPRRGPDSAVDPYFAETACGHPGWHSANRLEN
jgi:hypothetical protein